MEIKQLECFLKVAELLNFSRAAEALYISQPTLSYQISELEQELGVPLFERDRRKVYLTVSGQKLLEPARMLVEQATALPEIVRSDCEGEGLLRIGFDDTEDHYEVTGITEALATFGKSYPGVSLSMECMTFQDCLDQLIDGDLDVVFLILRDKEHLPTDLQQLIVFESEIVMVINSEHPAQTYEEAVENLDLLLVGEKPRGNSRILRTMKKMKLKPNIRHVDSLVSGFVYADMGQGIMLLSSTYYKAHCYPQYKALSIPGDASKIYHAMVWKKGVENQLVDQLAAVFKNWKRD